MIKQTKQQVINKFNMSFYHLVYKMQWWYSYIGPTSLKWLPVKLIFISHTKQTVWCLFVCLFYQVRVGRWKRSPCAPCCPITQINITSTTAHWRPLPATRWSNGWSLNTPWPYQKHRSVCLSHTHNHIYKWYSFPFWHTSLFKQKKCCRNQTD